MEEDNVLKTLQEQLSQYKQYQEIELSDDDVMSIFQFKYCLMLSVEVGDEEGYTRLAQAVEADGICRLVIRIPAVFANTGLPEFWEMVDAAARWRISDKLQRDQHEILITSVQILSKRDEDYFISMKEWEDEWEAKEDDLQS